MPTPLHSGSPVSLVELILVPDPTSDSSESVEQLRKAANEASQSDWHSIKLDSSNTRNVYPRQRRPVASQVAEDGEGKIEIADVDTVEGKSKFSWSWTLWRVEMPLPESVRLGTSNGQKWALVVRASE